MAKKRINDFLGIKPETKKTLTDSKGNASGLQIKQLKNVLKKLKEADPSKEEMIANIAVQTYQYPSSRHKIIAGHLVR